MRCAAIFVVLENAASQRGHVAAFIMAARGVELQHVDDSDATILFNI